MDRRRERSAWRSPRSDSPQPRSAVWRCHGRGAPLSRPAPPGRRPADHCRRRRGLARSRPPPVPCRPPDHRHAGRSLSARPRHHRSLRLAGLRFHPSVYYREMDERRAKPGRRCSPPSPTLTGTSPASSAPGSIPHLPEKAPIADPRKALGHLLGNGVHFGVASDVVAAGEGIETMLALKSVLPTPADDRRAFGQPPRRPRPLPPYFAASMSHATTTRPAALRRRGCANAQARARDVRPHAGARRLQCRSLPPWRRDPLRHLVPQIAPDDLVRFAHGRGCAAGANCRPASSRDQERVSPSCGGPLPPERGPRPGLPERRSAGRRNGAWPPRNGARRLFSAAGFTRLCIATQNAGARHPPRGFGPCTPSRMRDGGPTAGATPFPRTRDRREGRDGRGRPPEKGPA